MKKLLLNLVLIMSVLSAAVIPAAAADDLKEWQYRREIQIKGDKQYKTFFLDEQVYRYASSDLSDLRITDKNGEPVSYYLHNYSTSEQEETVSNNAQVVDKFEKNKNTYIDFKVIPVAENTDIIADLLSFTIASKNYAKAIEIFGSFDGLVWGPVATVTIYNVDGVAKNDVYLYKDHKYGYYRIKIPNNLEKIAIDGLKTYCLRKNEQIADYSKEAPLKYSIEQEGKDTIILLDNSSRMKLNTIVMELEGTFKRRYEVSVKNNDTFESSGVYGYLYNLEFKDQKLINKTIDLGSRDLSAEVIKIKIFNADDRPLTVQSIMGRYSLDKIVFEGKYQPPYYLYYGNSTAVKPNYDINLYKDKVEKEEQDLCSLGDLVSNRIESQKKSESAINWALYFNIIIAAVAVMLVVIIGRKLIT